MRTVKRTSSHVAMLLTLILAACGGSSGGGDNQNDAGLDDGGVDAAPPLRMLTERRLFGDSPVANRFYDPNFTNLDGTAWSPLNEYTWETSSAIWIFVRTPLKQPALRLLAGAGQNRGEIIGLVKSTPGPVEVSIWLGRRDGLAMEGATATLLGLFTDGGSAVDLVREDLDTAVILDDIMWVRFSARMDDGPVAWANLRVINSSTEPLYLTSPQLIRAPAQRFWGLPRPVAASRPMTGEERDVVRAYWHRFRDRF